MSFREPWQIVASPCDPDSTKKQEKLCDSRPIRLAFTTINMRVVINPYEKSFTNDMDKSGPESWLA